MSNISEAEIQKRLIRVVAEGVGVSPQEVSLEHKYVEDLGADSIDEVELVMMIEDEFDFEISDDDAAKMRTVNDTFEYLKKVFNKVQPKVERELPDVITNVPELTGVLLPSLSFHSRLYNADGDINNIASADLTAIDPHTYYFNRLFVPRSVRRQGIGTNLLRAVVNAAQKCQFNIVLHANPYSGEECPSKAQLEAWYMKFGFAKTEILTDSGTEPAMEFKWESNASKKF